ncbi:xanthine dehydrogenase family protein molybdopterin-binding subunit [Peristeroidobacter soli]|uniref:xanthine dehydrogenase family protein molybdopterin-binding subunit n=1 Tax=Peristeroidobacter soli TaxID=2497877 RepID=UPI00101DE475|nr:xanthine dehydrogenase family protein molybdopterin-binding subunit [Peristeroidobacter soli]
MKIHSRTDASAPLVGQPVLRREDARFLTGRGCYVDDLKLPGMVHAAVLRSTLAHGRVNKIDTRAALAHPGVLAVITAKDLEGVASKIPMPEYMTLPGYERYLQWPIATDTVRYVGEPIAIVVAENRYIAEDALELIDLNIEERPAVTTIDQALRNEVLVHEQAGTNLASNYYVKRGDVDAAFASAYYTRKEILRCHRHTGMPLETRGYLAQWDESTGVLTCWGASAIPRRTRDRLAEMLRMDREKIVYVENDTGGNFGVRGHFYPEDLLIAFLAMKLKRPVKYIEDRREHILATKHSREQSCEVELAINQDGTIAGMRARLFTDLGAYAGGGGGAVVPAKTAQFIPGPYKIDNYACEVNVVVTNKTPIGTYRGPGRYEGYFFCERIFDLACADLGLDPIEFRRKNLIRAEQMPYNGGKLVPFSPESDYDTGDYHRTLTRALELFDYDNLKSKSGTLIDGKWHGVAVCCYLDSTGMGPSEDARCVVKSPTEVEVYVGSSSSGQGLETSMAQIAADQLGLPYDSFRIFHGSTHYVENGNGHGHSRNAVQGGSAVFIAANNLIAEILSLASLRYNEARDNLEYRGGAIFRKGESEPVATFEQLVQSAQATDTIDRLQATGTYKNSALTYSYGAQAAHVAVDPETAMVDVVRFLTVEDIGRAINPMIVHGQTIGASLQGLSGTFLEEFVYDETGQILTGSLADYLVATATDFPSLEAETLEEARSKLNPLGVKGAGEGGISATGAVLANAVSNALASIGVRVNDLPISPNNLSRLIRDAKASKATGAPVGESVRLSISHGI